MSFPYMNDPIFDQIQCIDCQEQIISLAGQHARIATIGEQRLRESVVIKLINAIEFLPSSYSFLVKDSYRTLVQQKQLIEKQFHYVKSLNPGQTDSCIFQEVYKLVAPLSIAPHTTGGAIDLTLVDEHQNEIPMEKTLSSYTGAQENVYKTNFQELEVSSLRHRDILRNSMEQAGFVNYPAEWWHWSYGDKYWAHIKGHQHAIYCPYIQQERSV